MEEIRDTVGLPNFIGLGNYTKHLQFSNKGFWRFMQFTLIFTIASVSVDFLLVPALRLV